MSKMEMSGSGAQQSRAFSDRESVARKRIAELRMRLLDLSNANRLLNYKFGERSRRQIRLIDELPDELLNRLEDGKRLVFRSLPEPPDEPEDEKSDAFLLALEQAKRSDEVYLEAIKKLGEEELEGEAARKLERALKDRVRAALGMEPRAVRDQISKPVWARKNGIEPSYDLPEPETDRAPKDAHVDSFMQTLLFPDEMERVLSAINDQARTTLQETGVNTLYLAIGYLEWYEAPQAQTPMYAPLLLHPIDIERKLQGGKYRYSIGSLGEETEINITLSERLARDFGRRLPVLAEDDSPEFYLRKVAEQIKDVPRWKLRRFMVVGHFAFARLVMFHDLDEQRWPGGKGMLGSKVIADLFVRTGPADNDFSAEEYHVDEPAIAAKVPLLIRDADSSQFCAIADVMDGKNLVIKGPPGTGKSETITNIIAAALAKSQTVLFVAEKMAALNVVKERLEKAGLGQFCFELHSTKTRKRDVLESLYKRLEIQGRLRKDGELESALKELERTRKQLTAYVETINRPFGAIGKTIHGILWSEQHTRRSRESFPAAIDAIDLPGAEKITRHDLDELRERLEVLADAWSAVAGDGLKHHAWYGVDNGALDYFDRERLLAELDAWRETLDMLATEIEKVEQEVAAPLKKTHGSALELRQALARLPAPVGEIDPVLYPALVENESRTALARFADDHAAWQTAHQALAAAGDDPNVLAGRGPEIEEVARLSVETALDVTLGDLPARAAALTDEAERVDRAAALGKRLAEAFGIETAITAEAVGKLISGVRLAASLSHDLRMLRHSGLYGEGASDLLHKAKAEAGKIAETLKPLSDRLVVTLNGDAWEFHFAAKALRVASFPSLLWSGEVWAAKQRYRGLMRSGIKANRFLMAEDFDRIAYCIELAERIAENAAVAAVCGPHFHGHETDFEQLIAVNAFGGLVKKIHGTSGSIDRAIQQMLLEGPVEALARIAAFADDPELETTVATLEAIDTPGEVLEKRQTSLRSRAAKAEEIARRGKALGLKSNVKLSSLAEVGKAAGARLKAEHAIEANGPAQTLLGTLWQGPATPREPITASLAAADAVDAAELPPALRRYLYHSERDVRIARIRTLLLRPADVVDATIAKWSTIKALGRIDEKAFFGASVITAELSTLKMRVERALAAPDQLSEWTGYLTARQDCFEGGLGGLVLAFGDGPFEGSRLGSALLRVFYRTLARKALAAHPEIGRFRGLQLDKARERFRRLDEEILVLQRKALAAELCRRRIEPGYKGASRKEDTGLELIHHEIGKQKRHISIRDLLDRAGRTVQQMKPCFMKSPLSVAQFLKPEGLRFNLVVIDEASQMKPEEALGALARGGQAVVVGDPKQLPPTSFFDRIDRPVDDELDEDELIDNESILDLALTEFRPARSLRWHYRSRHESLIAFSNHHFYDQELIVFPSPLDPEREKRTPRLGVYHHYVGGRYKGHVNILEAQKVAEVAVEFMAAQPDKSLGIVALNQAQRDVLASEIDRLIARESPAQRYIERWEETLEPFFVKNLENVQGDERDVIFISTVYGPDAETGVVMNRFGPINGKYGHRRLNVLFTRAKDRVEVFTSLRPGDINIAEGSQPGMHALKAYLEYAETGRIEAGRSTGREPDSEFEELVRDRLTERGYEVVPQVGVAGYFIDLAVRHPKRSGYLLGIECDGATYHSSRSARDRDRLRQEVLERLKWNIYRIWLPDWFHNPEQELGRLLAYIEQLIRADSL